MSFRMFSCFCQLSYANSDIKPEDVMILLDDSVFGGAKDGVLLTKDFLFAKSSSNKPVFFKIDNIKTIDSSGLVYTTLNINGNKVFSFNQIGKIAFKEFCKVVEIYIEKSKNIEDKKNNHTQTIDSHSSQELNHIQNSDIQHLTKESNNDDLLLKMVSALDGTHSLVTQDKLYVHPNIPAKKIRNALDSYVHNVKPEDVMVLLDDTLFGSGSDGVVLTKKGLFIKPNNMNIKRIFGAVLTVLGIGGLIYAAVLFINLSGGTHAIKEVVIFTILGLIFFVSGISLIQTIKDN